MKHKPGKGLLLAVKLPWHQGATTACLQHRMADDGVFYALASPLADGLPDLPSTPQTLRPATAYIGQLVNEGSARAVGAEVLIPWDRIQVSWPMKINVPVCAF